jgi:hypothetical protein
VDTAARLLELNPVKAFGSRPTFEKGPSLLALHAFVCASLESRRITGENDCPQPKENAAPPLVTNVVHRFEESIAGRLYLIEVGAVSPDRWRADIVRVPGARSALMPFYGRTPDEAAGLLTEWLRRAHKPRSMSPEQLGAPGRPV